MSVINQVLLELEKRRASSAERGMLPDHVRALPDGGDDHGAWWLVAAGAAGIALLGVIWMTIAGYGFPRASSSTAPSPVGTETAIEKVVAASATVATALPSADALQPVTRLSFELSNPTQPSPAAEPQSEARPQGVIPAARVLTRAGDERSSPSAAETAAAPVAVPPSAVKDAPKAPVAAQVSGATDKPPAGTTAKAEIEKQVRQPTARELADHEYRKAASGLQQGRLAEAQEGFRAALNLHPGHHGARQGMVGLMLQNKSYGEAERALQEGVRLAPEQIGFAMTLARLQVDRGDTAGAIATLQGGVSHAHGSPDYLAFLAALLQRQGRHEDAIEQFSAALRGKPNTGVWWLGLAMSLQTLNRVAEAQEAYRRAKASNLNPELAAFADQRLRQLQ
jgi:MSHA biogenesis protein MshN